MVVKYNQAQKKAIESSKGPVLVIAGAGSGKTSVLIERIIHLFKRKNINLENILAVTFTNKAANEMKERIARTIDLNNVDNYFQNNVWIGTYHSICVRVLHQHIKFLHFNNNFNIYDTNDSKRLMKKCIKDLDLDPKQYPINKIYYIIEKAKNELINEDDFDDRVIGFYNRAISKIYKKYQEEMFKNQSLDFGDLILKTVEIFNKYPEVLRYYQKKFKHILIDEYQDINHAQYILIKLLSQKNNNVFAVGDPDQSIYKFRGAELSNIINFEVDYPECKVIKLEENYRSSDIILKGADFIIKNNIYRKEKGLWTKKKGGEKIKYYEANSAIDEAEFVAREIKNLKDSHKMKWQDFVILYRTNAQSRYFEEIFARQNIPFKIIGNIRFYERKEIKNLIYLMKLIDNSNDKESFRRWLEMDRMGIGPRGIEKLNKIAEEKNKNILDVLPTYMESSGNRIKNEDKEKIKKYIKIFKELKEKTTSISSIFESLVKGIKYYNLLIEENDKIKTDNKIENVKAFLQSIKDYEKKYPESTLNNFLAYISLVSDVDGSMSNSHNEEMVNLMTLHCAKGLEFPVVFLTGLEEGIFPHSKSLTNHIDLEEERRLCYVGMTRAMNRLYLTFSWRRNLDGKTRFNRVSRFFKEIPVKYLEKSEILPNNIVHNPGENRISKEEKIKLTIDDCIFHADWGEGTILNKKKVGDDYYITVNFKNKGIKSLSLKYAPIKKAKHK
jgi:DNA helicase-2/ATP-dependent DNA helicase PcrA